MLNERADEISPLKLLGEIQQLTLHGDDLRDVLEAALTRIAAALDARYAAIVTPEAGDKAAVFAAVGLEGAAGVRDCAVFEIAADGITYAKLRADCAALPDGARAFAQLAAGLLAAAFVRLEGDVASSALPAVDLANGRIPAPIELIHRVRNILSVIRVIVRRTAERAASVDEYAAQLDGRISALARVQTALITSQGHSTDLATLIDDEMLAHSIREGRMRAQGPRIPLKAKAAETLGLTLHELTENAIKFGALSAKNGRVDVSWWIDEGAKPRQLRLEWIESGVPVLSSAPRIRGFGHELIERTLPYELDAKTYVDFRPGGFRCALAIPLSDRVTSSDVRVVQ